MGISHFIHFSSIIHVIQWEVYILSISHVIQLEFENLEAWGGQMDGRMFGRTYGQTYGNSPLCSTGHRPFGAAAQKRGLQIKATPPERSSTV